MSKEKTEGQKLAEQLLYTRPHAAEASEELRATRPSWTTARPSGT